MVRHLLRRGLLLLVAPVAFVAVFAGLARLGWSVGTLGAHAPEHGPLMVIGVFGTIIALERAVAFGETWGYLGPCCGGLSAVAMLADWPSALGPSVLGASAGLLVVNAAITRRGPASFTWLMLLASVLYLTANVAWLKGAAVHAVVPAWLSFFVLTIVAERLELSRLLPKPAWADRLLLGSAGLLAVAVAGLLAVAFAGSTYLNGRDPLLRLLGGIFALMALWEFRFDLARRTLRTNGLPRFSAVAALLGAVWLLVSGIVLLSLGLPTAGPVYDAALHGVFVGFVLSMVFAHAPIILPAVARVSVPFHVALYVPLGVLHAGLALRIAGDLADDWSVRRLGGLANAVAVALFVLVALGVRGLTKRARDAWLGGPSRRGVFLATRNGVRRWGRGARLCGPGTSRTQPPRRR